MLAWPTLAIGTSVSFYIFLYIAYRVHSLTGYLFKLTSWYDWLFILFPVIALLSLIFAPYSERSPGFLADAQIWLQYSYWMILVLFIKTHGNRFDWKLMLATIFWAVNFLIISFYFIHIRFSFSFVYFSLVIPRNAYVFQLLCLVPLCLFYVKYRFSNVIFLFFLLFYPLVILLSEGRAGSIIIIIEVLLVIYLFSERLQKALRFLLLPVVVAGAFLYTNYVPSDDSIESVAGFVDDYNPRLASLIKGEGEGDLSFDKSWLLRELMIGKAIGFAAEWPVLGVGLHHFNDYDFEFGNRLNNDPRFKRLAYKSNDFYNTRSAHNSYFQLLAETGYTGIAVILLIIFTPVFKLIVKLVKSPHVSLALVFGLLGICIHYYVISSISGAIGWFTLGVAYFFLNHGDWISLPSAGQNNRAR